MSDDKQRIAMLTYALGLAIGALETVNLCSYDFNKDGVANVLQRLKEIAEVPMFVVCPPTPGGAE